MGPETSYERYVCPTQHGHLHTSVTDWSDYVGEIAKLDLITVDGHDNTENGEVNFNLTPSKWLKSDTNGHITTTDETPIAVDSQYTPYTGTETVVTAVDWTGSQLRKTTKTLQFVNGALVAVGKPVMSTIDSPYMITWV